MDLISKFCICICKHLNIYKIDIEFYEHEYFTKTQVNGLDILR